MMEEDPIIIRMNIAHFEAMLRHDPPHGLQSHPEAVHSSPEVRSRRPSQCHLLLGVPS
jgi:hypothetical protein